MEANMDEDREIESSPSESLAYGLLRQDIQQLVQEIRKIQQELRRLRERMTQISEQIELETSLRYNADAIQQRRMRTFMMSLSNLVNEYLSDPVEADQ
jgi:regulator of replication initiation timing